MGADEPLDTIGNANQSKTCLGDPNSQIGFLPPIFISTILRNNFTKFRAENF